MIRSNTLSKLRKKHFMLATLPETISVSARPPERPAPAEVPTEEATVDDIAIAMAAVETEFNSVGDRLHALRYLYRRAREAGALGADRAVDVLARAER